MDQELLRCRSSQGAIASAVPPLLVTHAPAEDSPRPDGWSQMTDRPQALRSIVFCCYGANIVQLFCIWVRSVDALACLCLYVLATFAATFAAFAATFAAKHPGSMCLAARLVHMRDGDCLAVAVCSTCPALHLQLYTMLLFFRRQASCAEQVIGLSVVAAPPLLIATFCALTLMQMSDSSSVWVWGPGRNVVLMVTPPLQALCSLVAYLSPVLSNDWVRILAIALCPAEPSCKRLAR